MRWLKPVSGLVVLVLLLTSCIRVDGTIKIDDDGSGSVDFLTALNTELLTSVLGDFDIPEAELGGSDALCDGFESDFSDTSDLPAGATVSPYEEDGFCGTRIQYQLAASTDHSAQITELFDDTAQLYKDGENWFFDASLDVDDITSEADGAPAAMMDALFGDASFRISLDLPGRAIAGEHNATEIGDDGLFIWDIDLLNPPARLFARTEPGSGGGGGGVSGLLIGLIIAALLGTAAFLLFLRQRGSRPTATPEPAQTQDLTGASTASAFPPLQDGPPINANPESSVQGVASQVSTTTAAAHQAAVTETDTGPLAAAEPVPTLQPVWDETLGAWTVDHPTQGRLRHDPASDTWNPI